MNPSRTACATITGEVSPLLFSTPVLAVFIRGLHFQPVLPQLTDSNARPTTEAPTFVQALYPYAVFALHRDGDSAVTAVPRAAKTCSSMSAPFT